MKKSILTIASVLFLILTGQLFANKIYAQTDKKKIVYQTFPALDSILCVLIKDLSENKHNKYIYAHLEYTGNYTYKIYVDASNDKNIPTGYLQVVQFGNRYLKICGRKIPVFLEEYDNIFANIREKNLLPGVIIYHGTIITFNAVEKTIISVQ